MSGFTGRLISVPLSVVFAVTPESSLLNMLQLSGTSIYTTLTAGMSISSGQAVMISYDGRAYVYDISSELNYGKTIGIAKNSSTVGNPIDVFIAGEANEPGSGWVPGMSYYVAASGYLSNIAPSPGIVKLIGIGKDIDTVTIVNNLEIISV